MLNIPIPPIFVSQNEEGVWDVIDGVQRLSTIFEFVGIFRDEEGRQRPPMILQKQIICLLLLVFNGNEILNLLLPKNSSCALSVLALI